MTTQRLVEALRKLLDAHEAEAKAHMSARVASENFSRRSAKKDEYAHIQAMMAASEAEKEARAALAAHEAEQAAEAPPLTDEQIAVLKFLDGSGLLRGAGYGCLPYGERRPFWWRRQLGDAFPQIRAHGITKDSKAEQKGGAA